MEDKRAEWTIMVTPEEKRAVQKLLGEMRKGLKDDGSFKPGAHFLSSHQQQNVYGTHVRAYYNNKLAGRQVSHKLRMLFFAAVYHVIAQRTGINRGKFWGPEYDRFLMDYCRIQYNESADKKGRYRQVGDVYKRYVARNGEAKMQDQFDGFVKEFEKLVPSGNMAVTYDAARVPGALGS